MPAWNYSDYVEYLRALVVLEAFYTNQRDNVEAALQGATILKYDYRPEAWPPSYLVAVRPGRVEVYINGTSNGWQVWPHLHGGAVGTAYRGGVAHSGMLYGGRVVFDDLVGQFPQLASDPRQLTIYGHSYGSGAGQIVADELIAAGRDPARTRVVAFASPKVYTTGSPAPEHRVDLIITRSDPVPNLPLESVSAWWWGDSVGGFALPVSDLSQSWRYRGDQQRILWSGVVEWDWISTFEVPNGEPARDWVLVGYHFYDAYIDFANRVAIREKWELGDPAKELLAIHEQNERATPYTKRIPASTWEPGVGPDGSEFSLFSASSGSKGVHAMASVIKCQAFFRQAESGWSETHYFKKSDVDDPTMTAAQTEFEKYLSYRAAAFHPIVRHGVHFEIYATRYSREGGLSEAWTDWTPTITAPTEKGPDSAAGETEPPFMGYLFRLYASNQTTTRQLFLRPLPNTTFQSAAGVKTVHTAIIEKAGEFFVKYKAQNCWVIKGQDKAQPKMLVRNVTTANLPVGDAYLRVTDHGLGESQEIAIEGGGPENKVYRGKYRVLAAFDANTLLVRFGKVVPAGPGGFTVRKLAMAYYPFAQNLRVGLRKRDTGRPIAPGRGRQ